MSEPSINIRFAEAPPSTLIEVEVDIDNLRTFGVVGDIATWKLTKAYFKLYENATGNVFHGEVDLPGGAGSSWSYTWNGRMYKEGGGQQIQVQVRFDTTGPGVRVRFNLYW